jgi:EmrB/QacA subfamily drug resistance transporter
VLDATIVNIALPSAQQDLGFSNDARQWVVTAYALAFGSLLLLGGRIGDLFGRKWTFIGGLLGFSVASAVGGAAESFGVLVAARAAQGVFGAMLAPSALALLATTFTDPRERGKAFGIFGAIAGTGAAIGLLLGGILTETLSWRWCLYVNLVIAIPAALAALRLITNQAHPQRPRIDVPGTLLATSGLFALVYGFSNSETNSWGHPVTIAMLVASVVLLGAFFAVERRVAHPLLPLRVLADRTRGGAFAAIGLSGIALFGLFLFLTYYLQRTLGFSPIETGLAFLPMSAAIIVTAQVVSQRLLPKFGPRPHMVVGMLLGAVAMLILTQLGTDSSYVTHVLPALIAMGIGMGNIFPPAFQSATYGVDRADTGVASAMVNTMQQVGGSIGTALLSSIFASATTAYANSHSRTPALAETATVHGYTVAFWVAAGVFALGAVVVALLVPSVRITAPQGAAEPVAAH